MPDSTWVVFKNGNPILVKHESESRDTEIEIPPGVWFNLYIEYQMKLLKEDIQGYIKEVERGWDVSEYPLNKIEEEIDWIANEYNELIWQGSNEKMLRAIDNVLSEEEDNA